MKSSRVNSDRRNRYFRIAAPSVYTNLPILFYSLIRCRKVLAMSGSNCDPAFRLISSGADCNRHQFRRGHRDTVSNLRVCFHFFPIVIARLASLSSCSSVSWLLANMVVFIDATIALCILFRSRSFLLFI